MPNEPHSVLAAVPAMAGLHRLLADLDRKAAALIERLGALSADNHEERTPIVHELLAIERSYEKYCAEFVRSLIAAPEADRRLKDDAASQGLEVVHRNVKLRVDTSPLEGDYGPNYALAGERLVIYRNGSGEVLAQPEDEFKMALSVVR